MIFYLIIGVYILANKTGIKSMVIQEWLIHISEDIAIYYILYISSENLPLGKMTFFDPWRPDHVRCCTFDRGKIETGCRHHFRHHKTDESSLRRHGTLKQNWLGVCGENVGLLCCDFRRFNGSWAEVVNSAFLSNSCSTYIIVWPCGYIVRLQISGVVNLPLGPSTRTW